jgi:CheY-like chemotaxis protein
MLRPSHHRALFNLAFSTDRYYAFIGNGIAGQKEQRRRVFVNERSSKGTILLIDDEEVVRELGKDILETFGYRVILAAEGNEGVRLFKEHMNGIDLVILDMSMPEKSGKQVYEELRMAKASAKIIICSGSNQGQDLENIITSGVAGFLQKPFLVTDLIGKVEEALGR